jgi:hypothetical protein
MIDAFEKNSSANITLNLEATLQPIIDDLPEFIHYKGSLPAPPCTENTYWYVFTQPVVVDSAITEYFFSKNKVRNYRINQALNGRREYLSNYGFRMSRNRPILKNFGFWGSLIVFIAFFIASVFMNCWEQATNQKKEYERKYQYSPRMDSQGNNEPSIVLTDVQATDRKELTKDETLKPNKLKTFEVTVTPVKLDSKIIKFATDPVMSYHPLISLLCFPNLEVRRSHRILLLGLTCFSYMMFTSLYYRDLRTQNLLARLLLYGLYVAMVSWPVNYFYALLLVVLAKPFTASQSTYVYVVGICIYFGFASVMTYAMQNVTTQGSIYWMFTIIIAFCSDAFIFDPLFVFLVVFVRSFCGHNNLLEQLLRKRGFYTAV